MDSRIALACIAAAICARAEAQTLLGSASAAGVQNLGVASAEVGDWNGDGVGDFAVSSVNGSHGLVRVFSGAQMTAGAAPYVLYAYTNTDPAVDHMGTCLLASDIDGDGVLDLVIGGGSRYQHTAGAIKVIDGATGWQYTTLVGALDELGASLADAGDVNSDGYRDVIAGAPTYNTDEGRAFIVSGRCLVGQGGPQFLHTFGGYGADSYFGSSVASLDVNGDSVLDFAIGSPLANYGFAVDEGIVRVFHGLTYASICFLHGASSQDEFGYRLARAGDVDGDGVDDLMCTAQYGDFGGVSGVGTVTVYSGAQIASTPASPPHLALLGSTNASGRFGHAIEGGRDVTGDGVDDMLIAMISTAGAWEVISGASLTVVGVSSVPFEWDYDSLAIVSDHDGDSIPDVLATSTASNAGNGIARLFSIFPGAPTTYCTSQTNSLGCTPSIGSTGVCSASSSAAFNVIGSSLLNQKSGLLFYGFGALATPFQGGYLCVHAPTVRTAVQNSGGASSGSSCTGSIALDFNARIHSGVDPSLVPGAEVFAQVWSRDPASAFHTNRTNAVHFLVGP